MVKALGAKQVLDERQSIVGSHDYSGIGKCTSSLYFPYLWHSQVPPDNLEHEPRSSIQVRRHQGPLGPRLPWQVAGSYQTGFSTGALSLVLGLISADFVMQTGNPQIASQLNERKILQTGWNVVLTPTNADLLNPSKSK